MARIGIAFDAKDVFLQNLASKREFQLSFGQCIFQHASVRAY